VYYIIYIIVIIVYVGQVGTVERNTTNTNDWVHLECNYNLYNIVYDYTIIDLK